MSTAQSKREEDLLKRIGELEQQVRDLAVSSERYHAIVEAAGDAIFVHDLNGRFLEVNEQACLRLGYTRSELLSMSVRDIDSPAMAAEFERLMQQFIATGRLHSDTEHRTKDGRILSIELSSRLLTIGGQQLVISVARDITERKKMQAAMNARNEQVAALNAIISERSRLGREIHDSLAQVLAYAGYKAHAAADLLRGGQAEQGLQALAELEEVTRHAHQDARSAILELRTPITASVGLLAAVRDYAERFEREWGIATRVAVAGDGAARYTAMTELQLLRIVHEALTNVRRHAQAKQAIVTFEEKAGGALVTIEDDGKGFTPDAAGARHDGLTSMRERAAAIGGELTIESTPGRGTRVLVHLPRECLTTEAT